MQQPKDLITKFRDAAWESGYYAGCAYLSDGEQRNENQLLMEQAIKKRQRLEQQLRENIQETEDMLDEYLDKE